MLEQRKLALARRQQIFVHIDLLSSLRGWIYLFTSRAESRRTRNGQNLIQLRDNNVRTNANEKEKDEENVEHGCQGLRQS